MRPSSLQSAAATSVPVEQQREEKEARWRHQEHNPRSHTSLPFPTSFATSPFFLRPLPLFFLVRFFFVRLFSRLCLSRSYLLDVRASSRSSNAFALPPPPFRPGEGGIAVAPYNSIRRYVVRTRHGFIALSGTRESHFHLLAVLRISTDSTKPIPPICLWWIRIGIFERPLPDPPTSDRDPSISVLVEHGLKLSALSMEIRVRIEGRETRDNGKLQC